MAFDRAVATGAANRATAQDGFAGGDQCLALHGAQRLRMAHGARSVLRAASVAQAAGKKLDHLRQWGLTVQARTNHNKAACALANKLARICYATLRDSEPYGTVEQTRKKMTRTAFAMPA